jgi:hypothetical protein
LAFSPILLARFGHAALCAQFLILLALAVHFASIRTPPWRRAWLFYLPLLVIALLVHVYLLAMVAGFALATLLHALWTDDLTARAALGHLAVMVVPVVLTMAALGYFALGAVPLKPYGEWPLNIAAPFVPGWSVLAGFHGPPPWVDFESYAWVGAGIAVLVVAALPAWWGRLRIVAGNHGATITMIIAVLVFAVSFSVQLGPWTVLGLAFAPLRAAVVEGARNGGTVHRALAALTPWDWVRGGLYLGLLGALATWLLLCLLRQRRWQTLLFLAAFVVVVVGSLVFKPYAAMIVASNFQASARFIWMLLYLVMLLAIAEVSKGFTPVISNALLLLALAAQVVDTAPLWGTLREDAQSMPQLLPGTEAISSSFAQARDVVVVPTYLCSFAEGLEPDALATLISRVTEVDLLASRWALPINSVRNSRMSAVDRDVLELHCSHSRQNALLELDKPGRVTLALAGAPAEQELRNQLVARPQCSVIATGVLCRGRDEPGR